MTPFIESVKSDWKTMVFYFAAGLVFVFTMPLWAPTIMALVISGPLARKYTARNKEAWVKAGNREEYSTLLMMSGAVLGALVLISFIGSGPGVLGLLLAASLFAIGYATRLRK